MREAGLNPGRLGVVAGDLPAAAEAALPLAQRGQPVWLLAPTPGPAPPPGSAPPAEARVVGLATGGQHADPPEVRARVAGRIGWLRQQGIERHYLAIDPTLGGHPAHAIDEARSASGAAIALVAAASPGQRLLQAGGYLLADGVPVASDPHLPSTFERALGQAVGHVALSTVLQGWEAIAGAIAAFREAQVRLVVIDATLPEHLQAVVRAALACPWPWLPAGTVGFAEALAAEPGISGPREPLLPAATAGAVLSPAHAGTARRSDTGRVLGRTPPTLVLSGSTHPATLAQIGRVRDRARLLRADVRQLLLTDGHEREALFRQALQGLLAGVDVVVATTLTGRDLDADRELGRVLGLSAWQVGAHLAEVMGQLAAQVVARAELGALVATGGETAEAVVAALPLTGLQLVGEAAPGVPLAVAQGPDPVGRLRLVLKAGGFGEPDALARLLAGLRERRGSVPHPHPSPGRGTA